MRTLIVAYATIHMIGLCAVFDANVGIDVVLPDVNQHTEAHTAIIAFPREVFRASDWPVHDLPAVAGYQYIVLTGERVAIDGTARNPEATVPAGLPRLSYGCGSNQQQQQQRQLPPLSPGYQPPYYPDASAVVAIPRGESSACHGVGSRADTMVRLANRATVTIEGLRGGKNKKLVLAGHAQIIIANLPTSFIDGTDLTGTFELNFGHYHGYYTMLAQSSGCQRESVPPLPECGGTANMRQVGWQEPLYPPLPPHINARMTPECSNTTYP